MKLLTQNSELREIGVWNWSLPTTRVGIPANNIPPFRKRQAGRTFGEMQRDRRTVKPVDA